MVVFVRVPHSPLKGLVYVENLWGSGAGLLKAVYSGTWKGVLDFVTKREFIKATR